MMNAAVLLFWVVPMQCYPPPVAAPIVEPFVAPACPYCPGHRGVEYDVASGTVVHAVASGVVTFSGVVAGTRYVVVLHDDGISATYGLLASATVAAGDAVGVGEEVGRSGARLYFGLRRGGTYLDPQDFFATIRYRPRLVPSSGARRRPAVPSPRRCPIGAGTRESAR